MLAGIAITALLTIPKESVNKYATQRAITGPSVVGTTTDVGHIYSGQRSLYYYKRRV